MYLIYCITLTGDKTVAGNCWGSPTSTRVFIPSINGISVSASEHWVASSTIQQVKPKFSSLKILYKIYNKN